MTEFNVQCAKKYSTNNITAALWIGGWAARITQAKINVQLHTFTGCMNITHRGQNPIYRMSNKNYYNGFMWDKLILI